MNILSHISTDIFTSINLPIIDFLTILFGADDIPSRPIDTQTMEQTMIKHGKVSELTKGGAQGFEQPGVFEQG